jgi:hypothetical protein
MHFERIVVGVSLTGASMQAAEWATCASARQVAQPIVRP